MSLPIQQFLLIDTGNSPVNINGGNTLSYLKILQTTKNQNIAVCIADENMTGSHKVAAVKGVLDYELTRKKIVPNQNQTIAIPTGGNFGIYFALRSQVLGLKLLLHIPHSYSPTKQKLCKSFGATVYTTDTTDHEKFLEVFDKEIELSENQNRPSPLFIDQTKNIGNVEGQYKYNALPFFKTLLQKIDIYEYDQLDLVLGMGSGGSLMGMYKACSELIPLKIHTTVVEPEGCSFKINIFNDHPFQGLSISVPYHFKKSIADDFISISTKEAIESGEWLLKQFSLSKGLSTLANISAAMRISKKRSSDNIKSLVVTMTYDQGYHYILDDLCN